MVFIRKLRILKLDLWTSSATYLKSCYNIIMSHCRKQKKFESHEIILDEPVKIDRLTPTGQGIGTLKDGKKVFLWNALPGEIISKYLITKSKSNFEEGIATKISNKNIHRVEPKDPQYLATSPWQIMDDGYEKTEKTNLISELFHNIELPEVSFHDSPKNYFYRNKMEYALYFDKDTNSISLAVHTRGTHQKIPIEKSSIERPEILLAAKKIVDELNKIHANARDYQSMLLRCDQNGNVEGGLFENHKPHPVFNNLKDKLLDYDYSYSPNGFFQINLPIYELALSRIKFIMDPEIKNVLDLYSGVGTIGLSVARDKNLTLVEIDKSAYKELENNCKNVDPNSNTIHPIFAKSEDALTYIKPDSIVILDTPGTGCDDKLIQKLLEVHPKQIIYLSCNPATEARDIEKLTDKYHINTVDVF